MTRFYALGRCLLYAYFLWHRLLLTEAQPGFISIDCGGATSYTDSATGISWVPDRNYVLNGSVSDLGPNVSSTRSLQTLRYFSGNQSKNCFTIGPVTDGNRYLVRGSFLYGSYDGASVFPSFGISVGASPWATITIIDAANVYSEEFIATATDTSFIVCLYRGQTGNPFISSLELRPITGGMYSIQYLNSFFLKRTVRINFGAPSTAAVRYPDDPTDRIWVSDQVQPLQGEATGTFNINTTHDVDVNVTDRPPEKVMQTAVVGGGGTVSYRLNLAEYPAQCYAVLYLAEIQDLGPNDTRAFVFQISINNSMFAGAVLNLARDVGVFKAFEPGFTNVTLPSIVTFSLLKDNSSTLNPVLNAMEIYQILPIIGGTHSDDVIALSKFTTELPLAESVGDPCLPVPWDFLSCNSDSPPRVSSINLSGRNLTGSIPATIGVMIGLVDLWLDNNNLTGTIPNLGLLANLQTLHLQENDLSGPFPQSLGGIKTLREIFVQNNQLSGTVPLSLLENGGPLILAGGNLNLCANISCLSSSGSNVNVAAVVGGVVGGFFAVVAVLVALCLWMWYTRIKKDPHGSSDFQSQAQASSAGFDFPSKDDIPDPLPGDGARLFYLPELVEATNKFSKEIGSGGFGPVYYGRIKDGQEIAVKVLSTSSNQGAREFFNEVNLLSRVHHRNLVTLIGYCSHIKERMLVYEYMHHGSLRDHLYGHLSKTEPLDWLRRLNVALDAAKGLEYLHTGCSPSIIHRDVKSSNILINAGFVSKVADFGLSKLTSEGVSMVSTTVRGTVGYLDPEYYVSQQLTTKSDVFSFGVVLLELISGREPIIVSQRGSPDSNIVNWARGLLQKGDVQSMIDPEIGSNCRMESIWKVAELAITSVEPYGKHRPTMGQIVAELAETIQMETSHSEASASLSDSFPTFSSTRTHSPSASFGWDLSSAEIPPPVPVHRLTKSFDDLSAR